MRSIRVVPFLLSSAITPAYGYEGESKLSQKPSSTLTQPLIQGEDSSQSKLALLPSLPEKLGLGNLFNRVIDSLKAPDLTLEESKALDEVEGFLKKYTGNGKFNYGTIPRLIEGLKHDYCTVNEEGSHMKGLRGIAARKYPNNLFRKSYCGVQQEIIRRGYAQISERLVYFEVDPRTANDTDNSAIRHYVTKPELERFDENLCLLEERAKRILPLGKRMIFREGFSLEAVNFIRAKKLGLPPGATIVDAVRADKSRTR